MINVAHRAALVLQDQEVEVATNLGGENDQRRPEAEGTARSLRGPKNTGKEAIHRPLVVGQGLGIVTFYHYKTHREEKGSF